MARQRKTAASGIVGQSEHHEPPHRDWSLLSIKRPQAWSLWALLLREKCGLLADCNTKVATRYIANFILLPNHSLLFKVNCSGRHISFSRRLALTISGLH